MSSEEALCRKFLQLLREYHALGLQILAGIAHGHPEERLNIVWGEIKSLGDTLQERATRKGLPETPAASALYDMIHRQIQSNEVLIKRLESHYSSQLGECAGMIAKIHHSLSSAHRYEPSREHSSLQVQA